MKRTDKTKLDWPKDLNKKDKLLSRKIYKSINSCHGLTSNCNVFIACSGGLDSTVLSHATNNAMILSGKKPNKKTLVYINHNLRSTQEIEKDIKHIKSLANNIGFDYIIKEINIDTSSGNNIQAQARDQRYNALSSCIKATSAREYYILVAHHANDIAETKLFQFLTGRKVTGIKKQLEWEVPNYCMFERPLLGFTRENLESYAKAWGLSWVEDSSNSSDKYSRNFIRNKLIPTIQDSINPGLVQMLAEI